MNKNEIAHHFEVSLTTINNWIRRGMPYMQAGGKGKSWRFDLAEVEAWQADYCDDSCGTSKSDEGNPIDILSNISALFCALWIGKQLESCGLNDQNQESMKNIVLVWLDHRPKELLDLIDILKRRLK